tara:strand:- start:4598 stop:4957 length:360 start_codon:yes stop_codon:yes gene_type:complete
MKRAHCQSENLTNKRSRIEYTINKKRKRDDDPDPSQLYNQDQVHDQAPCGNTYRLKPRAFIQPISHYINAFSKSDLTDNIQIESLSLDEMQQIRSVLDKKIRKYMQTLGEIEQILNIYL